MTEWMGITAMKINNIKYLLKEGIRGIFLHGFMSFAAVCVTVACLVIVGSFFAIVYNGNILVEEMNKTNQIIAYVDISYPEAEAKSVGTQINQIENIQNAVFVNKEEALDAFLKDYEDNESFSGVVAEDLRYRYEITLMDNAKMEQTIEAVRNVAGVAHISAAVEMAEGFETIQNGMAILSIAVIVVLLVVSLLIISNTVKIAMYDRRDEIAIMKMVGATNGFIRLPFIVEGFVLGMFSAVVAFGIEWVLYDVVVAWVAAKDTLRLFSFVPSFTRLLWPMIGTFSAAGMFVGIVGSWNSIRKFMDV